MSVSDKNITQEIIIGIVSLVCGTGLGAWLAYLYSIALLKKQRISEAGAVFRAAFANEISLLRQRWHEVVGKKQPLSTHEIIKNALTEHELAWIRFRDCLSDKDRTRLDKLWMKYSYEKKKLPGGYFLGYKMIRRWENKLGSMDAENKIRNIALDRIYKMFQFTKLKK